MKSLKYFPWGIISIGIVLLLTFFPFSNAMAYTAGPLNAGLGSNDTGIGSEAWVNPGEITTPGAPYATVTLYQGHRYSNYLQGTQFGFNLPPEAQVSGIEVSINRLSSSRNPNINDNVVSLLKGGTILGDNKADTTLSWPTSLTVATYGGPTDLWGIDWTANDINAADFGVVLAVYRDNNGNNSRDAAVDYMQVTVYYGNSTTTSLECGDGSPVMYGDGVLCKVTVSQVSGELTPTGTVNWSTDGSGTFEPNPCTLSEVDGVAACSATYTPNAVGTGTHLITASYSGDDSFMPNEASQPVTVTKREVTVTADPKSKMVDQPDPELTYQLTAGSLLAGDAFDGELTREPGEAIGTYAILQGTLSLPEYYTITFVGANFTITQAVYYLPIINK